MSARAEEVVRDSPRHGSRPEKPEGDVGFRGTGPWWWFAAFEQPLGPCATCGTETDRWVIGWLAVGPIAYGAPHANQPMRTPEGAPADMRPQALLGQDVVAQCWPCGRKAAIAVLERRQQNMEILEAVRATEAAYLAELVADERSEAPAGEAQNDERRIADPEAAGSHPPPAL